MATGESWTDLLDPTPEQLQAALPPGVHEHTVEQLLRGAPRPKLEGHAQYVHAAFLVAVALPDEDDVFYQEVEALLTRERIVTVRRTPPGRDPYDVEGVRRALENGGAALVFYHLADDIAQRYVDLVDTLDAEIDELEDSLERWGSDHVGRRMRQLRHQILHVRHTLTPMRDAIRGVIDGRIEVEGAELFPHELEQRFVGVYDTLLRATEGLEFSRDLLAAVRDYNQAKIANDQNEVVKRLTAIASILLLPTFIVGLYGQNFAKMPEYQWGIWGYVWSWGLIVATTVLQVWYFRRKRWL
jgi:magnesium transporter